MGIKLVGLFFLRSTVTFGERIPLTGHRRHHRRPGRARAAAFAAALAALAGGGEALASDELVPDLGSSGDAGAVLDQAAAQASETLEAAGSDASAVQEGASNVALPTVEASPGAQTVVTQENDAAADAAAANEGQTAQVAGQGQASPAQPAQESQPPAQAGQSATQQGATQGSTTTQAAGAQATVVQTQPVNVAIPIVIASPGANTVIVQTNNASAAAQAANTAATTQVAGQIQTGSQPAAGSPQGQPPPPPGSAGPAGSGAAGPGIDQVLNTVVQTGSSTWIWIWNWTWNSDWDWSAGVIDLPPVPSLPPVPGWTPPGDAATGRPPEQANGSRGLGGDGALHGSPVAATAPAYESLPPAPLSSASREARRGADLSSIFVQSDAEPVPGRLLLPPIGRHVAPGGSAGGGIAPLTLVVGALLALALQLLSAAGLLGRRFALTSVGWRRQAYLTPLERPG